MIGRGGPSGESSGAGPHSHTASRGSNTAPSSASAGSVAHVQDAPESSHSGSQHSNEAPSQRWVNDNQGHDGLSEDAESEIESDDEPREAGRGYAN